MVSIWDAILKDFEKKKEEENLGVGSDNLYPPAITHLVIANNTLCESQPVA